MKVVVKSAYSQKAKEYPMNSREDLAAFLHDFPAATHAAVESGVGNVELMAKRAAMYLSSHHLDVQLVHEHQPTA